MIKKYSQRKLLVFFSDKKIHTNTYRIRATALICTEFFTIHTYVLDEFVVRDMDFMMSFIY